MIRAGVGNTVRKIAVSDVVCFEATEKYVNVITPTGEALVRMSLRELMARIDSTDFIQMHRSVMVNSTAILSATRDENGHYSLSVRGIERLLKVSRAVGYPLSSRLPLRGGATLSLAERATRSLIASQLKICPSADTPWTPTIRTTKSRASTAL